MFQAGDYDTTETVVIPFNTFSSDDPAASVTVTDLVAGDVEIHKDGGTTQRASDNGVTVTIDFDTVTGNHTVAIDLSDNSDAGFYAAGSRYQVRVEGTTIDGATVNAWIGTFSIGCVLRPTVAGRTLDVNATGEAGLDLDNTSGTIDAAQLGTGCITVDKIAADAITADKIADDAIGDEHWNVTSVIATLADGAHGGSSASLTIGAGASITSSGTALTVSSGGNGHGVLITGSGTGEAISLQGGGSGGFGVRIYDGLIISNDAGHAISASSTGGNGHGLFVSGNGTGKDFYGAITGNITGNLSGSVGSVTAGVNATQLGGKTVTAAAGITVGAFVGQAAIGATKSEINTAVQDVTVGDIATAALAKFLTQDTGETTAAAGSVGKIAQGAAGNGLAESSTVDGVPILVSLAAMMSILMNLTEELTAGCNFKNRAGDADLVEVTYDSDTGERTGSTINAGAVSS